VSVRIVRGLPRADDAPPAREPSPVRVVPAARHQAALEAASLLASAKREAERIVEAARVEAAQLLEAARSTGRDEGLASAAATLARAREEENRRVERSIDLVLAAARAIAERAVGRAIALDDATLGQWVAEVLASMRGARRLTVQVHPAAAARLATQLEHLPGGQSLRIVEDATMVAGAVVVRSELGEIRIDLPTQVELLARALRDAVTSEMERRG
jgi:flagellar biosynthesis/type III secretory pathway protein FliH